jgi:hypothetical protein
MFGPVWFTFSSGKINRFIRSEHPTLRWIGTLDLMPLFAKTPNRGTVDNIVWWSGYRCQVKGAEEGAASRLDCWRFVPEFSVCNPMIQLHFEFDKSERLLKASALSGPADCL